MKYLTALAWMICDISLAAEIKITVAADGSGDFKTVQEAIAAAPEKGAGRTVIRIKAGIYRGPVIVPANKPRVTFLGEGAEKSILTYALNVNDPIPEGADKFNPGLHIRGDDFQADGLTIQNTSGDHGQALALRVDGDRAVFRNCRLLGWQDTVMLNKGRQYFKNCHIEGRVDFIYGDGTAVFESCTIHSKNGGYITAASTPADHPFGFVFIRCKLTGAPGAWIDPAGNPVKPSKNPLAYLGRPWRPHGSVAFLECEMGSHIRPEGWHNWRKPENEQTARYAEYGNTGPGAATAARAAWGKLLAKEDAEKITVTTVLSGTDGWNPSK